MEKTIAIFGASGKTGEEILKEASSLGLTIRAIVRRHSTILPMGKIRAIECDYNNKDDIKKSIKDVDGVIIVFGPRSPYTDVFCEKTTSNIIEAMKAVGIKRLICQTGAMIGDYIRNRSVFFELMCRMYRSQNPLGYNDRVQQERVIKESGLDWTIIKPPRLINENGNGDVSAGENVSVGLLSSISRRSLAKFILEEVHNRRYFNKSIFIRN